MSINTQSNFMLLNFAVPVAVIGVFYFAFQLANQPTMLLTSSLQNVLAPILAKDRGNPKAERKGVQRVFAGAMLFVPITTVATASLFPSVEDMLWNGKWDSASAGLYWLCVGATYATVAGMLTGPLLGLRRFREVAAFEMAKTVGTVGGAALGGVLVNANLPALNGTMTPVTVICMATGLAMTAPSLAQLVWIVRRFSVPAGEAVRHMTFGPMLAVLTALAAQSVGHSVRSSFDLPGGRLGAAVDFATVSIVYGTLILLAVRFTAESTLRDTVSALPMAVRRPITRVLGLG